MGIFTVLCGFFALCAFVAEGSAAEWGSIFLVTVKHADQGTAGLAYGIFAVVMGVCRLFGDRLRQRYSDVEIYAVGGAVASLAMVLVIVLPHPVMCLAGYALLGLGLFPLVPIAMSRAGSGNVPAAKASAVVSLMAYGGLLVVPPILGWIAHHQGLTAAFFVPLGCCVVLMFASRVFRR